MEKLVFPFAIASTVIIIVFGAAIYLSDMSTATGLTSANLVKDINTVRVREHVSVLVEDDTANGDAEIIASNICKGMAVTLVDLGYGKVAEHYTTRTSQGGRSFYSSSALVAHWLADPVKKKVLLRPATLVGTYAQFCGAASAGPTVVVLIRSS